MTASSDPALYKRHRYPAAIIAHAAWLYFRFALSYRDVEELLAARGISVTWPKPNITATKRKVLTVATFIRHNSIRLVFAILTYS